MGAAGGLKLTNAIFAVAALAVIALGYPGVASAAQTCPHGFGAITKHKPKHSAASNAHPKVGRF